METAFLAGFMVVYFAVLMFSVAVGVVYLVALWKLFEKAGEPGWKALIPYYNFFEMTRLATGKYTLAIVYLLLCVPYMIFYFIGVITDEIMISLFGFLFIIPVVVLWGYIGYQFGKAYGKSSGVCVAMIFFRQIVCIVIGFDKDTQYIGPKGVPDEEKYYY